MRHTIRILTTSALLAATLVAGTTGAASAQYGGDERGFIVTPKRVPHGSELSGVGFGCTAGATVTITIDGQPGVFTTVVAEDDSTYRFDDVSIPIALVIGDSYTAVASCDGGFDTDGFTVICANGDEPDPDGECPVPTTSSVPATTTVAGSSGSTSDPLAFTGADTFTVLQLAATIGAVGALFILLGRRRDREEGPVPTA